MLMDICLPKFDIYQSTVAKITLRATQALDVLISFFFCMMSDLKLVLSNVT